jgi:hypothetical protein
MYTATNVDDVHCALQPSLRIDLISCFGKQGLQLHHLVMPFLAELHLGGISRTVYSNALQRFLDIST